MNEKYLYPAECFALVSRAPMLTLSSLTENNMGAVFEEFERDIETWRHHFASDPKSELVHLFLIALEREELVSVGYREDLMRQRLAIMPLDADVKELIQHALIWAWKDEEMHAIYIRGAILRLGDRVLTMKAYMRQMAGAVGGWSSSIRQHVRWRQAPLSRSLATLVTWAGTIAGAVPKDVREHLRYRPFRQFCLFNVDAEKTAWLCWQRISDLAQKQNDLPPKCLEDFVRVQSDEDRHRRIFQILADALDESDQLVSSETSDSLARKIGGVGDFFLPRSRRVVSSLHVPLGAGGKVWVRESTRTDEKIPEFRRLLIESRLEQRLAERAALLGKPISELKISIKPTFMLGYHTKDTSPLTDPALVIELANFIRTAGCAPVSVIEGRNIYDHFYGNRGVKDVARYFGIEADSFHVVDAGDEQVEHNYFRGMAQYSVSRTWKEADFRITFGKMRSHPIEMGLFCVGNLEWLGARCDEFLFVERQAHRETATMMLVDEFSPDFALLDAFENVPDGLLGVMGCPRPKSVKRFYASADALSLDVVAARHIGVKSPRDSSILRAAIHWFGGVSAIEVVGPDTPIKDWRSPYHNEISALMSFIAFPVYVLGSGRGSLFVPEMDEEAFPPLSKEGFLLRTGRRCVRALVGLRNPK